MPDTKQTKKQGGDSVGGLTDTLRRRRRKKLLEEFVFTEKGRTHKREKIK